MKLIFNLQGRLGNIFFIFSAFYYALKNNIESYIYIPEYVMDYINNNDFLNELYNKINNFTLTNFNKSEYINLYDKENENNIHIIDLYDILKKYNNQSININFECVMFQNCKYFLQYKNEIKKIFINETENTLKYKQLISENDVLIFVRRTDYITYKFYILNENYYIDMYNKYFTGKNIYVTSDDIDWCKENLTINKFKGLKNIYYINDLNPIETITICQYFSNFICSNSTFSMMGELFSNYENKKVIAVKNISKIMKRNNGFDKCILYDLNDKNNYKYIND